MKFTPEDITELAPNEVIVFGSNEKGIMGGGLAKVCKQKWGAKTGIGEGHLNQCYALPTKRTPWETLSIDEIKCYVDRFIEYAKKNQHLVFLVTKVGTGLAKINIDEMAPLFREAIYVSNIVLPKEFSDNLLEIGDANSK